MMDTYKERVERFVVEYHELMYDRRKAEHRLRGIDPDAMWMLMWSFDTISAAEDRARSEEELHAGFCRAHGCKAWKRFRVRDLGLAIEVERPAWF